MPKLYRSSQLHATGNLVRVILGTRSLCSLCFANENKRTNWTGHWPEISGGSSALVIWQIITLGQLDGWPSGNYVDDDKDGDLLLSAINGQMAHEWEGQTEAALMVSSAKDKHLRR